MKKKIFALITAIVCVLGIFSFSACGHKHDYKESVIAPTCTELGYTLHTCECGESYKDNYVSAKGHNYINLKCTECKGDAAYTEGLRFVWNAETESYFLKGIGVASDEIIKIPSEYKGKPVTRICDRALSDACENVKTVIVPDSVTVIGSSAFGYSESITTIYLGSGIKTIVDGALNYCSKLTDVYYNGTAAEWETVDKGSAGSVNYTVHFSDGV